MIKLLTSGIIRPPRDEYELSNLPLLAELRGFGIVHRTPVEFKNPAGETLFGSFYHAPHPHNNSCVIYLHGNASNQLEGVSVVSAFIPLGISVFCFDFSGCGRSTAQYVTLGFQEHADLLTAVNLLRSDFDVQQIALWGRSMGAAVALLSLPESEFACAVVDSPFADMYSLSIDIGRSLHFPKWLCKRSVTKIRKRIVKKTGCDIFAIRPIDATPECDKPVFFVHGKEDSFIPWRHSQELFDACACPTKELHLVEGDHCSERPLPVTLGAVTFICRHFGLIVRFSGVDAPAVEAGAGQAHRASAAELFRGGDWAFAVI
jgi:alpha-beta hydrolase superfamily lysophospholipase